MVRSGSKEVSLEETGCYRTVGVWENDENLKALCDAMNSRKEKTAAICIWRCIRSAFR